MALRMRLCRVDDVPAGGRRAIAVAGLPWPVLVVNVAGALYASAGVCPHEDVALVDGDLEIEADGPVITCPGHGYQFALATGQCTHDARLRLPRYRITIVDDEVWIDLA
jgi:nitrite reductase/ring-hydroxylating ferredoxin subunit